MKLGHLLLGLLIVGVGYLCGQPIYIWFIPIPNPFATFTPLLYLAGGILAVYGVFADEEAKTRKRKKGRKPSKPKSDSKFYVALAIAGFFDLADWLVVGLIPIAGDVLDVLAVIVLFPLIGPYALINAIELIPMLDILPFHLASVFAWKLSQD